VAKPTGEVRNEGPRYELDGRMGINPAIDSSADAVGWSFNLVVVLEYDEDPTQLLLKRQEFITTPPITAIMMGLRDWLPFKLMIEYHTSTAILRNNTGIRVGLLLDMFDKLRAQALWQLENGLNPPLTRAFQPLAFFRYSGPAVLTCYQEGGVGSTFAWSDGGNVNEDQERARHDSEHVGNEGMENREGGGMHLATERLCRSVVRGPTFSESTVFENEDMIEYV